MEKKPLQNLLGLAWPVVVSRSTQVVVGLADALMVAHLGTTALAAVTTGAMNSFAAFVFPMGIAFVIGSFSSQLTGRQDPAGARRYGFYGLALALAAQLVMLAGLPALQWVLGRLAYEPGVESAMAAYMSMRLLSTGAAVGIEALGAYYGGTGDTAILMRVNVAAMLLNVVLNWLLIDGHLGLPALGVRGAALASVLSTTLAFLGFLAVFLRRGKVFGRLGLAWAEFGRLLRFGAPSGFNFFFEFFAFIVFINLVVAKLGTSSLAAFMAVLQLNSLSFMPAFGLGTAGSILVGQAIGAGRKDKVGPLLWLTFRTAAVWMGVVGLAYLFLPRPLLAPFTPAGEGAAAFVVAGVQMLVFSAFWQVFDAGAITVSEALRAAGDTDFTMWARIVLAWGVFVPGSWISVHSFGGGVLAAVAWMMAYMGLLALVLWLRFRGGAWKRIELVETPLPV